MPLSIVLIPIGGFKRTARGFAKDEEIFFSSPTLYRGSEVNPLSPFPRLLETDPLNGNYHNNVLEWDYGVCLRRIRIIEGRFLGAWVFLTSPRAAVRIKYNQTGNYRLRLGQFAVAPDEEYIPTGYFEDPLFGYPLTISDTATFYPDADPEQVRWMVLSGILQAVWVRV